MPVLRRDGLHSKQTDAINRLVTLGFGRQTATFFIRSLPFMERGKLSASVLAKELNLSGHHARKHMHTLESMGFVKHVSQKFWLLDPEWRLVIKRMVKTQREKQLERYGIR